MQDRSNHQQRISICRFHGPPNSGAKINSQATSYHPPQRQNSHFPLVHNPPSPSRSNSAQLTRHTSKNPVQSAPPRPVALHQAANSRPPTAPPRAPLAKLPRATCVTVQPRPLHPGRARARLPISAVLTDRSGRGTRCRKEGVSGLEEGIGGKA
ncbi:uncharacterized protein CC84DRAFT_1166902 [Paraphaeosphaeria sporulosa]|uniref:Uncharacterized protein n=1 Tax=Paraphaeosphaeria sporulosa TaxID=1460663 RepID=A0A177C8S4_9PLEO|nr:uncharacterized protein CC84DRAFT_1166902 [Paraphaeosphaeria sporulosa]OAG03157.1 hypothetical protein CC84DRAFT_1166902 [Paraphaeosphaeria sporulosa]